MILDKVCELFTEKKDFQFLKGDAHFDLKSRPRALKNLGESSSPQLRTNK
jgi:hypothetical protein